MTAGTEPESTSGPKQKERAIDQLMSLLPGLLAFVYFEGYIAANSYFARLEFTKSELLSGRYVSAGVLFLVLSTLPLAGSLALWVSILRRKPEARVWWLVLLPITAAGVYATLIQEIVLRPFTQAAYWRYFSVLFVIGFFLAQFLLLIEAREDLANSPAWLRKLLPHTRTDRPGFERSVIMATVAVACLAFFALGANRFGGWVYPSILPEYGGGASVLARIALRQEASREARDAMSSQILSLVDQDDHFLYVLVCGDSGARRPVHVYSVALGDVNLVDLSVNNEGRSMAAHCI